MIIIQQLHHPERKMSQNKELIIIKSRLNESGNKRYYITDQNHDILHEIKNTDHIEWILNGDYADENNYTSEEQQVRGIIRNIVIKEDILYDINDDIIIESILSYFLIHGTAMNVYKNKTSNELKSKYKREMAMKLDEYSELLFKSKIVYLFETDTIVANLDGRYLIFENILFLFSQAPEFIFECSNSMFDKNDQEQLLLVHYFRQLGTIKNLKNPFDFNII